MRFALMAALVGVVFVFFRQSSANPINQTSNGGDMPIDNNLAVGEAVNHAASNSEANKNVRNNNPLNIEYNAANDWVGQVGSDGRFAIFEAPEYGFRSGYILLKNYMNWYGLNTVALILHRFAPPEDNNPTSNYALYVARQMGVDVNATITIDDLPDMMLAMSYFEGAQGEYAFNSVQVDSGVALA